MEPTPLIVVKTRVGFCHPHHFVIDDETRTVQCGRCKKMFDPIAALLELVRDWKYYMRNRKELHDEIERLQRVRDEVHREVQNLKAQKRRAER